MKELLKSDINSLLMNDFGEFGCERIVGAGIKLPKRLIKSRNYKDDEKRVVIWDVFRSNTESGIAVNNYYGETIDFSLLSVDVARQVRRYIKSQRIRTNMEQCY